MGIYFHGAEMPKDGNHLVIFSDGEVWRDWERPKKIGTAIELPPHGRLIDADAFLAKLKKDPLFPLVEKYGMSGVIEAQPTIIPADPGGEPT